MAFPSSSPDDGAIAGLVGGRPRQGDEGVRAEATPEPRNIPWSYGEDRATAAAVDPDRLYVYWEVTDGAIERARRELGASGFGARLNLRVHDTTHRLFDGSNAHGWFDRRVAREDRQLFLDIGKPASEAVVEVGLLSDEGDFVKIARSKKVEFPRREPAPFWEPEWMLVRGAAGEIYHRGHGMPAPAAPAVEPPAERFEPVPLEMERMLLWEGPVLISSWEAGPFVYPIEVGPPTVELFSGPVHHYQVGGRTHILHGAWEIVIRGLSAEMGRRVIARWEIHRTWTTDRGEVRVAMTGPATIPGASEQLLAGASERRWLAASEMRLGGASELAFLAASERRLGGASERVAGGVSERRLGGASELRLGGASEQRLGGSENRLYPPPPTRDGKK